MSCIACEDIEPTTPICSFPGDPDIAGMGIIVSFMVSSWSAFNMVMFAYFFIDDGIPFRRLNSLDSHIISFARLGVRRLAGADLGLHRFGITKEAIRTILLSLSDQQLVTSIAMLTVGFSQARAITEYHFEIINDLGWISFTIYQCVAMVLADRLQESYATALWRVAWIVCLAVLLFVSTIVTWHDLWLVSYGTPAQCLWSRIPGGYSNQHIALLIIELLVLLWSAVAIVYDFIPIPALVVPFAPLRKLVAWFEAKALSLIRWPEICQLKASATGNSTIAKRWWQLCSFVAKVLATHGLILADFSRSTALDLLRIWGSGLTFTIYLFKARTSAPSQGLEGGEDTWGFGQGVAVFMLLLPLCGIIETYYGERTRIIQAAQTHSAVGQRKRASSAQSTSRLRDESAITLLVTPSEDTLDSSDHSYDGGLDMQMLRRCDTEARVASTPSIAATSPADGQTEAEDDGKTVAAFRKQYYGRKWFRAYLTVLVFGLFGLVTFLATTGIAV